VSGRGQQASSSFFDGDGEGAAPEKEPKKLLSLPVRQRRGTHLATRRAQGQKSFFASFFSKKEDSCLAFTGICARGET
jgi:hypothetical protein